MTLVLTLVMTFAMIRRSSHHVDMALVTTYTLVIAIRQTTRHDTNECGEIVTDSAKHHNHELRTGVLRFAADLLRRWGAPFPSQGLSLSCHIFR